MLLAELLSHIPILVASAAGHPRIVSGLVSQSHAHQSELGSIACVLSSSFFLSLSLSMFFINTILSVQISGLLSSPGVMRIAS